MFVMGWLAAAGAVAIDIVRFSSPKNKTALESHPVYGSMLRQEERHHFNASTYMVLSSAILVTFWRFGLCREATLVVSVAMLGTADPAAAWVRHMVARRGVGGARAFGVLGFSLAGVAVMWPLCRWLGVPLDLPRVTVTVLLVGLLEAHAGWGVRLLVPLTERVRGSASPKAAEWMRRLYPDDNLLIPLAVAGLMELLHVTQT
jgi:dolichol kinase